jgi:hypothetical protein
VEIDEDGGNDLSVNSSCKAHGLVSVATLKVPFWEDTSHASSKEDSGAVLPAFSVSLPEGCIVNPGDGSSEAENSDTPPFTKVADAGRKLASVGCMPRPQLSQLNALVKSVLPGSDARMRRTITKNDQLLREAKDYLSHIKDIAHQDTWFQLHSRYEEYDLVEHVVHSLLTELDSLVAYLVDDVESVTRTGKSTWLQRMSVFQKCNVSRHLANDLIGDVRTCIPLRSVCPTAILIPSSRQRCLQRSLSLNNELRARKSRIRHNHMIPWLP